jgi:hypothetical protein
MPDLCSFDEYGFAFLDDLVDGRHEGFEVSEAARELRDDGLGSDRGGGVSDRDILVAAVVRAIGGDGFEIDAFEVLE